MIVTNLIGGLGNQMFQYAAGRGLSLMSSMPLKLDTRDFSGYGLHQGFELNKLFNCNAELACEKDLDQVIGWQSSKLAQRILRKPLLKKLRKKSFVVEPCFNYWDGFDSLSGDIYLDGYWQSEKYFKSTESVIRSDFVFKQPLLNENQLIADQISSCCAVSLHVRRGDYVQNPVNLVTHGVCSIDYYHKAVNFISGQVSHPIFFIFSDDIKWVKENLEIAHPSYYVDINHGAESYNDMRLMSMCQHHIIANSSFSWWGAWLNSNHEKIVIAPKRWFNNKTDAKDLIPDEWVML